MTDASTGLLLAALAGAAIPAGGWLGSFTGVAPGWRSEEFRHSVVAFGAGALLAAVFVVLIPEGIERLPGVAAPFILLAGGLVFAALDGVIEAHGGHIAQFLAMMLDFLPEALALGALLGGETEVAAVLAALIAVQNLPEGFNAFREIKASTKMADRTILLIFLAMVPFGPLMAWIGMTVFSPDSPVIGAVMIFASGGILYLLFEDIAPMVPLENAWAPPLGAVGGVAFGLAGHSLAG